MIRPATPSSASISRSIVPFPMPPKDGLQEQTPKLSSLGVMSAVRAPERAAAAQASVPACPPPTTTTSKGLTEFHVSPCGSTCVVQRHEPGVLRNGCECSALGAWRGESPPRNDSRPAYSAGHQGALHRSHHECGRRQYVDEQRPLLHEPDRDAEFLGRLR